MWQKKTKHPNIFSSLVLLVILGAASLRHEALGQLLQVSGIIHLNLCLLSEKVLEVLKQLDPHVRLLVQAFLLLQQLSPDLWKTEREALDKWSWRREWNKHRAAKKEHLMILWFAELIWWSHKGPSAMQRGPQHPLHSSYGAAYFHYISNIWWWARRGNIPLQQSIGPVHLVLDGSWSCIGSTAVGRTARQCFIRAEISRFVALYQTMSRVLRQTRSLHALRLIFLRKPSCFECPPFNCLVELRPWTVQSR